MTPQDLYHRLSEFPIDERDPDLPFEPRLAREHGWTPGYARRVVAEYRKFVFLAATSAEPVCPSEDVDAAWHLHLTCTRSYWTRLCGEVLGRPLHHDPTRGGPAEADRHLGMYAATLAAYREAFGDDPPADIWPPPGVRFGDDLRHRVVNTARNWVVPKSPVKRILRATVVGTVLAVAAPGCAGGGLNPFNLVGTDFLGFLIPMMAGAVLVGRVVRFGLRGPGPRPGDDELTNTWEQAAYLAGGIPGLTTAAITRLVESGAAELTADRKWLERAAKLPDESLGAVETAVYNLLPFYNTPSQLRLVQAVAAATFAGEAACLEHDGFVLSLNRQFRVLCGAAIPILSVLVLLGLPRVVMGLAHDKPVVYLLATMGVGGMFGLALSVIGCLRLSRRGQGVLTGLRGTHAGLRGTHAGLESDAGADAAWAVALFGTAALAGSPLAYLQAWFPRITSESSPGGCGTSFGGDGGGGGCGGGGGGGCGGCGGGG